MPVDVGEMGQHSKAIAQAISDLLRAEPPTSRAASDEDTLAEDALARLEDAALSLCEACATLRESWR